MVELSNIASYVSDKINSTSIELKDYITTDNILQNKAGRTIATNLPPNSCSLTAFRKGDVLIANIRPYLKKIWKADSCGGASNDVLVFRAKDGHNSDFLYSLLLQDSFFDHCMKGAEGAKMPRGNKSNIMRFNVPSLSPCQETSVGNFISNLDKKIALNKQINCDLEAMAKQLYDYWFVQFDFPNEEGKPYKSSGGKMVWNETLKREIPEGWEVKNIFDALDIQYGFPFSTELFVEERTSIPVVRIRDIIEGSISAYSTEDTDVKYKLQNGDLLIGMDGNFHMNYWHEDSAYLNQRSVRLRSKNNSNISSVQAMFGLKPSIKAKEQNAKGSTVGHLSDKDLKELNIVLPIVNSYFKPKELFDNILFKITSNKRQSINLQKQRDELLPLLMNGQVSIK